MSDKDNSLEFIKQQIEKQCNHIVRQDHEIKGIINIEAKDDGSFNVKLHRGTQNEAVTIEDISKEKLLDMMEEQL